MYERCKKDFFFVCYLFFLFLFYPSFFLCSSILFSSLPNFFFLLSSYRYYFFVSWTKVPREPDEKIVRSPKLLVFLNNVRRDIICYIYFTLRGDFRLFIFPPPYLPLLSFIRSFSSSPSTNAGSVDRSFRTRPMYTELRERISLFRPSFHDPLHFSFFFYSIRNFIFLVSSISIFLLVLRST